MTESNWRLGTPNSVSRRRFLTSTGVAGAIGLAGCSGENSPEGSGGNGGGSGGPTPALSPKVDQTFRTWEWVNPAERYTWNPWAQSGYVRIDSNVGRLMFEKLAFYNYETQSYEPWIAKDWTIEEDKAVITLDQEFKWSDGDRFSADDLLVKYQMDKNIYREGSWDNHPYIGSVESKGSDTFQINLSTPANKDLFKLNELVQRFGTKGSVYKPHLEKLENASKDEFESVRKSITGGGDSKGLIIEDPPVPGPWKLKAKKSSQYELEPNEHYKHADKINFTKAVSVFYGSDQKKWQALKTGNLSGSPELSVPPQVKEQFPDFIKQATKPCWCGLTLMFQFDHPLYSQRGVREAFAWLLNRQKIVQNMGSETHILIEIPSGLKQDAMSGYEKGYLGDLASKFQTYAPKSSKTEKATSLLEGVGFTKENGKWIQPDGKPWKITIKTASQGFWTTFAQAVSSQLKDFGIDAQVKSQDNSTYWGTTFANGDYNVAVNWSGGWNPHPWFTFNDDFISSWQHPGQNYPGPVGSDEEFIVEVPMPVGDPNGDPQKVDLKKLVDGIQTASSAEKERELVQKVAWVYNQDLPKIPYGVRLQQMWNNTNDWWYVDNDHEAWGYAINSAPSYHLPRRGLMRAKQK